MSLTIKDEMKDDHELIKIFQKGDKSAYDRLVRKYLHNTVGFFYTITGDRMVAEDLAQDVFLKLFNTFGAINDFTISKELQNLQSTSFNFLSLSNSFDEANQLSNNKSQFLQVNLYFIIVII